MSDNLQLGALDAETNQYVTPTEAEKGKRYKCVECKNVAILRKGEMRKAHFAHRAQTSTCNYYDHPNESQIHKDAKMLMVKLLTEKKQIQFLWKCDYPPCYGTWSSTNAFHELPTIIHKDGDEVKVEYRDPGNKWVADVALVNKGELRYIFEIKHTHATTTARPEPWFEIDATQFITDINELNAEHPHEPEIDEMKICEDWMYGISCVRTDIVRYCYGSFCYKESWTKKIPGYYKEATDKNCIFCNKNEYLAVCDGCTSKFTNGQIRVCYDCLIEDTHKKRLRLLFATKCYGHCFVQDNAGGYKQGKCPDKCTLKECPKCKSSIKHPEWYLSMRRGDCPECKIGDSIMTYLDVPFARKDEAKMMGAKWDSVVKKWCIFTYAENKTTVLSKFKEVK